MIEFCMTVVCAVANKQPLEACHMDGPHFLGEGQPSPLSRLPLNGHTGTTHDLQMFQTSFHIKSIAAFSFCVLD